jgi:hypothetical protein
LIHQHLFAFWASVVGFDVKLSATLADMALSTISRDRYVRTAIPPLSTIIAKPHRNESLLKYGNTQKLGVSFV